MNNIFKKYIRAPRGIDEEIGDINLEILLVNSLKINAIKVQEVTDAFLEDKPYISIFCFTETKVDCVNFIPIGLKTFNKQRVPKKGTLKGGDLTLGYIEDNRIIMEDRNRK